MFSQSVNNVPRLLAGPCKAHDCGREQADAGARAALGGPRGGRLVDELLGCAAPATLYALHSFYALSRLYRL